MRNINLTVMWQIVRMSNSLWCASSSEMFATHIKWDNGTIYKNNDFSDVHSDENTGCSIERRYKTETRSSGFISLI